MSAFIFFIGSSSVGKTELLNAFPTSYDVSEFGLAMDKVNHFLVEKVKMEFRAIREQLGNPKWEDLIESQVGVAQQEAGMKIYEQRIYELKELAKNSSTYVFERSPFDIAGYSYSFHLPVSHIQDILNRAVAAIEELADFGHKVILIFRPVQFQFSYDRQNNARPPEEIRDSCNQFLMDFVLNHATVNWKNHPGIVSYFSVNQGKEAVQEILELLK